ncbi:hypothetical protein V8G54_002898 [Vigna mungo]|uniref:Uncharacterized protein n=1 Tax=Vigna mungo TaxID=3915 RepID=A0AAQ3S9N0_VIGMU
MVEILSCSVGHKLDSVLFGSMLKTRGIKVQVLKRVKSGTMCNSVLVLSHELLGTEGRSLKQSIQSPDANKGISIVTSTAKSAIASQSYRIIRSLTGDVEAFRPTTPGHSPGVGH